MLTFTVPEPRRPCLRRHQRLGYDALFAASAGAIKTLTPDPKFIGGDQPGFFGVLPILGAGSCTTPPPIHYLVPGGAFNSTDGPWPPAAPGFFLPVRALSQVFRAKFRDQIDKAGLRERIPPAVWTVDWNVNCQAIPTAEAALKYLAHLQRGHLQ